MRKWAIIYSLVIMSTVVIAQPKPLAVPDSTKKKSTVRAVRTNADREKLKKMILPPDTLTMSDYTLSLERVNDNLITIGDSARFGFEVVKMSRQIGSMAQDIDLLRENIRGRQRVFNLKNLFLYQSFTSKMDEDADQIQAQLDHLYKRVYHAKLHLKTALTDSVFRKLYADKQLRTDFDEKLIRLEKRWSRTDSLTKVNVDTLNALKIRLSDISYDLSNMLNILDLRMDRTMPKLFGHEVNYLWEKADAEPSNKATSRITQSAFQSEQKAIGYYITQTSGERKFVIILAILLFAWLYMKRKLLAKLKSQKETYSFLNLQYLNKLPALSLIVILLCLMPFFDAYAPTSYISIVFVLLLFTSTLIFLKKFDPHFLFNWFALAALFAVDAFTYLMVEPGFMERVWMLAIHSCIIVFIIRFLRTINEQMPFHRHLKTAGVVGIFFTFIAILNNLLGRFSLSGMVGIAGIYAVTQAFVLTIFVEAVIEIFLLQLLSSRLNKGIDKPFDTNLVVNKIKMPLILVAVLLWLIMLTSNLNLYHGLYKDIADTLTATRTIGSISFHWLSVILFFLIIWLAHILQRLVGYFFGETGTEAEDLTTETKGHHSRLLITRLLVLIGGYILAIAASGLPIDKLTFLLGALGVGIGMGLQGIVNNVVSGIILIFEGSLKIGDEIEASGQAGKVKEIGLRASTLTTADGADVIIPNGSILSQNIVNWTFSSNEKRVMLNFTLWGKELDANVINEVINNTIQKIPNVSSRRKPVILFTKASSEFCSLTVRFWSTITNVDLVRSEAVLQLSTAFASRNIEFE